MVLELRFTEIVPPRSFNVGQENVVEISDCGRIRLEPDEMVTFENETGVEYDVVRKDWGFYATPSLNGRLLDFKLHAALVRNQHGKYFIFLVQEGKEREFEKYLYLEKNEVVLWLDNDENLSDLVPERVDL